jgi:hypothetical protein
MKPKLLIIGSSLIINEHIKSAIKAGFDLYSINSTKTNSNNEKLLYKKYNFSKKFKNWRDALESCKNNKNVSILLAPRIQDNFKIIQHALKGVNYIFSEKPISKNSNNLKKLLKYNNRIFVGYNRVHYNAVKYLKNVLINPSSVIVKFTENNLKNIFGNSIHIISILNYLFGKMKIIKKLKKKDTITLLVKNMSGTPINIIFTKNSPETFSIDVLDNNKRYLLKPLEKLFVYKKLNFKYLKGNKKMLIPVETPNQIINEYSNSSFKAGFLNQMKSFKKFVKKKYNNNTDINFSLNVTNFCKNFF